MVKGIAEFTSKEIDWDKVVEIFKPEKESWRQKIKKGIDKYPTVKELLPVLAATGTIAFALLMPGLAAVVAKEVRWQQKHAFLQRVNRLKKRKLVEINYDQNGEAIINITEDGKRLALTYKFSEMKIKKPRRWDHKWRVVIFDIPNTRKIDRERFRSKLKTLGFYLLNESVFVHPYPCFSEIEYIRQVFLIGGDVTYLIAEKIENQNRLYNHFNLKQEDS